MLRNLAIHVLLSASLLACAASPSVEEIAADAQTVVFLQHGRKPLLFEAGVINTDNFWATYGEAVSRQLGGNAHIDAITDDATHRQALTAERNALLVESLYDEHPLADNVADAVLPALANTWNIPYTADKLTVIPANTVFVLDEILRGRPIEADLVLLIEIQEARLTEIFTARSVIENGVTLGTNTRQLTVETPTNLKAFKRNRDSGALEYAWGRRCGANYTSMRLSATLAELWRDPLKMEAILDEASALTIEHCLRMLAATK